MHYQDIHIVRLSIRRYLHIDQHFFRKPELQRHSYDLSVYMQLEFSGPLQQSQSAAPSDIHPAKLTQSLRVPHLSPG